MDKTKPLTKRQKRKQNQKGTPSNSLDKIDSVVPLTLVQKEIFKAYFSEKNLFLHGSPGTGKTFLALYLGMNDVLNNQKYEKVIIIRSAVPSRDIGFLPGTAKQKMEEYEQLYVELFRKLFKRQDAFKCLEQLNKVEFSPTSFLRGRTFDNCVIILDEIQNYNWAEINTALTRVGDKCRVIISGDTKQTDLDERRGKGDLLKLMRVCEQMNEFEFFQMRPKDIVRSGFVKEYILACEKLGY